MFFSNLVCPKTNKRCIKECTNGNKCKEIRTLRESESNDEDSYLYNGATLLTDNEDDRNDG